MQIAGRGCLDMLMEAHREYFLRQYKTTHWQNIVDYQTFHVTELRRDAYEFVVILEAGGGVNRVIQLGERDFIRFLAEPRCAPDEGEPITYSNTCGIGYMRCFEHDGKYGYVERAFFCLDNSPYDLSPNDSEWPYIMEDSGEEIVRDLIRFLGEGHTCTHENTLYITQL